METLLVAAWISRARGVWLSSTPVFAFGAVQRSGCPGGLVLQTRESAGKAAGAALGARRRPTDRSSGAEKSLPRPAGERPLTSGHLWPLLPGAPGRLGRCCTAVGAACAPVSSAASPPPGKVSLIST